LRSEGPKDQDKAPHANGRPEGRAKTPSADAVAAERAKTPSADAVAAEGTAYVAWHTLVHAVLVGLPLLLLDGANDVRGGVYEGPPGGGTVFSDAPAGGDGSTGYLYHTPERVLRLAL